VAVTPALALLQAHLQATWNRSRRELGTFGRVMYGVFLGLVVLLGALPTLGLALVGGWYLGRDLGNPVHARVLGGILGGMALFGGLAGGVAGGSRVLAWEGVRTFPVKLRSLFAAELVAGLGDLLPLTVALTSLFLLLGTGAARPRLLPLLPLPWLGTVGGLLCIQYLVNSLAVRAVKRLQVGLTLLGVVAWASLTLLPALGGKAALFRRAVPALGALGGALLATPPLQCAAGLREAALGHWGAALGLQLYPLAALGLLLLVSARLMAREAEGARPQVRGRERLWSFPTPVLGVARLHWRILISSHLGKFGLLVPLMVLVFLKGPASRSATAALWGAPASFAYLALSGVQMQLNQFGLDGPGVKTLLLLPLTSRDLLAGKALGLLAYMGAQALLFLTLMAATGNLPPAQALPALCLSGCLFFYQVSLGHWTSAWLPRPMPRDSLRNHNLSPAVVWLGMGATLAGVAFFGGAWALAVWLAPALLLPVMALLLGCAVLVHRRLALPLAAQYLDRRREALVHALGRNP